MDRLVLRSYRGPHDNSVLARIVRLVREEPFDEAQAAYHISAPGFDPARDLSLCCNDREEVLGFAWLQLKTVEGFRQGWMENFVPPSVPNRANIERELLLWTARRMQEELDSSPLPARLIERIPDEDFDRREFLEVAGFRVVRYYHIMRLDAPSERKELLLPPGFAYIHGPGHAAAEEYAAMHNETWVDHYGFSPITPDDIVHDIDNDPEYDASLDIVLQSPESRYVGFAYCRLMPKDRTVGEVIAIGIRRGSRKQGLGRMLLVHAIHSLIERGASRIELTVDTESPTGAGRLYESVGFRVVSVKRRYQLDQDGILRLATVGACCSR